jgi:hypothetical protein
MGHLQPAGQKAAIIPLNLPDAPLSWAIRIAADAGALPTDAKQQRAKVYTLEHYSSGN